MKCPDRIVVRKDGACEARGKPSERHKQDELPGHGVGDPSRLDNGGARLDSGRQARKGHHGHDGRCGEQKANGKAGPPVGHRRADKGDGTREHAAQGTEDQASGRAHLTICLGPQKQCHGTSDTGAHAGGREEGRRAKMQRDGREQGAERSEDDGDDAKGAMFGKPPNPVRQHGAGEEGAYVADSHEVVDRRARVARPVDKYESAAQVREAEPGDEDPHAHEGPGEQGDTGPSRCVGAAKGRFCLRWNVRCDVDAACHVTPRGGAERVRPMRGEKCTLFGRESCRRNVAMKPLLREVDEMRVICVSCAFAA